MVTLNKVIDLGRVLKKDCFIFKVDFKKAYDSMSWSFLEYMLRIFDFDERWMACIRACVFSKSLFVMVNNYLIKVIHIKRRVQQEDFMALFLFLLVVERLTLIVKRTISIGASLVLMLRDLFLEFHDSFLHCKMVLLPFKYLRFLVGANPMRKSVTPRFN